MRSVRARIRCRVRHTVAVVMMLTIVTTVSACSAGGSGASGDGGALAGALVGSGATFPKAFYEDVIAEFEYRHPATNVTYAGGGSGKGRTDLQNQVVDWAGSDGLVKAADKPNYKGGAFLYFPTVAAPITVAYNLAGVTDLRLTPEVIAKIFQREITEWDDPAIVADNPTVQDKLKGNITVVHRSDGSGTTENFTIFLDKAVGAKASPASTVWRLKSGSTVEWPSDTQAGNGNAGVTQIIRDTRGSIGYVDLSDAIATKRTTALVRNRAGNFVAPTLANAKAALAGAVVNADLTYDPLWVEGADAYPITAPTWILVYATQTDRAKAETLRAFLTYLLTDGQAIAKEIDYAELPDTLRAKAVAQIDMIVMPA